MEKQPIKRTFTSDKEQLKDSVAYLTSDFKLLEQILPQHTKELSEQLAHFCSETFVLRDNKPALHVNQSQISEGSYKQVFDNCIENLLCSEKKGYVQCQAHQYNKLQFDLKNFNFGTTLLSQCPLEELGKRTGLPFIKQLLSNYLIFIQYEGQYIQVAGMQLQDLTHLSVLGQKKKKAKESQLKDRMNYYNYSDFTLDRFQMFYCRHMGRNSGIFRKNDFFLQGIKKSDSYHELPELVSNLSKDLLNIKFKGLLLKDSEKSELEGHLTKFIIKFRDLIERRPYKGKMSSKFDSLLARHCPLQSDKYRKCKERISELIKDDFNTKSDHIFEDLYTMVTPYRQVSHLLVAMLEMTVPKNLLGSENFTVFLSMIHHFVDMKRFQNYKIEDILNKMNVFSVPWFEVKFSSKHKKQVLARCKYLLAWVIKTIFNKCVISVIKYNFYITEKHKEGNKIFYFRKPIWVQIAKLAVQHFSRDNLRPLSKGQINELNRAKVDQFARGKLRILPKKGTFRPIITFNRKVRLQGDHYSRGNLNQILSETQLVLRNLKNVLASQMGYSIFDNRQISKKYDNFVQKWRNSGQPPLAYFTLDIQKCYDSIDTAKLKQIIQSTSLIEQIYLIVRYFRIYRNKKPLVGKKSLSYYFNLKQRSNAVRLQDDPMKISEQKMPAVNIFTPKCRLITRQQIVSNLSLLCTGAIVQYEKYYWKQKVGIPQGLNVSGVLCSLYFASLQKQSVEVSEGLLMRLTDDYIYIGPVEEAGRVLNQLFSMADAYGFKFNADKITANFEHPLIKRKQTAQQISWIGKRININTLQMFPFVQTNPLKLYYAMNVNAHRKTLQSYFKNKLKSLFTNHFASYFKPYLFSKENLIQNLKIATRVSLGKYFPFLLELENYKVFLQKNHRGQAMFTLKIMHIVIRQFVIYACYLCRLTDQSRLNLLYSEFFMAIMEEAHKFFYSMRPHKKFLTIESTLKNKVEKLRKQMREREMADQSQN